MKSEDPKPEIVPIHPDTEKWSDQELEVHFINPDQLPRLQMFGAMAKRSGGYPKFTELLREEAISSINQQSKFFGFIKISWIPVIAMLEHGSEKDKSELKEWVSHWSEEEIDIFCDYIRKEDGFLSWFR